MKASIHFTSLFWVFFFVICAVAKGEGASPIDMFIRETSQVKQRIVNEMDSFFIKCNRLPSEVVLTSRYSGGDIPLAWELGWQGQNFYTKRTFFPTEAQKKLENIFISEIPTTLILKNGAVLEWDEGAERCNVDNLVDGVLLNMISEWEYFEFLGYNVAEKIITSSGNSYKDVYRKKKGELGYYFLTLPYLPESIIDNYSKYSVNQEKEKIDGHDCFVIEWKDKDTLWADQNHHWVIRQRTTFTDDKHKKFTVRYHDYREIESGVWFPFRLSVDVYADTTVEPRANWDKIAKRRFYDIQEVKTSQLPESLFAATPPPGTRVIDHIRKETYTIWDPNVDPFAGPIAEGLKANRYVKFRAITIIIGSILIFIAVWRLLRNKEDK